MITTKQESVLIKKIKSLTELELQSLFEELADHIRKNNLSEVIQRALDIDNLREEYDVLERNFNELEEERDDLSDRMRTAWSMLSELEIDPLDDELQKEIDKISDYLF